MDPRSVSGAFHTCRAVAAATSPTQTLHGWWRAPSEGAGAPPVPGRRTNAMRAPSGDQRGLPSREVLGAIHVIGDWASR
jgi:hypothetical protein